MTLCPQVRCYRCQKMGHMTTACGMPQERSRRNSSGTRSEASARPSENTKSHSSSAQPKSNENENERAAASKSFRAQIEERGTKMESSLKQSDPGEIVVRERDPEEAEEEGEESDEESVVTKIFVEHGNQ